MPILTSVLAAMWTFGVARAQDGPGVVPRANWEYWETWGAWDRSAKVFVVTVAQPSRGQSCRVRAFEADRIVCRRSFGGKPVIFRRSEVEAVIEQGGDQHWAAAFGICAGIGVAMIVAGAVLSFVAAPAVIVLGSLVLLTSPAYAIGANPSADELLYLQPGQRLTVSLNR
jgi:hypothetical protein